MIWLSKFYKTVQRTRNFQAHPVQHLYTQNLFRPDAVLLSKFNIGTIRLSLNLFPFHIVGCIIGSVAEMSCLTSTSGFLSLRLNNERDFMNDLLYVDIPIYMYIV